jgi:hypothetical protein
MRRFPAMAVVSLVLWAASASATVLRRASLDELVDSSAVVFHGRVVAVDDDNSEGPRGPFRTTIELEVLTVVKGLGKDTGVFTLTLPGGRAGDRVMHIPGMPRFSPGDEVVLLLEPTSEGHALAGLGQGVFRVIRADGEVRVVRELGGAVLLDQEHKPSAPLKAPRTLDELLAVLGAMVVR